MRTLLGRDVINAVLSETFTVDGPVAEVADDASGPIRAVRPLQGRQVLHVVTQCACPREVSQSDDISRRRLFVQVDGEGNQF